MIFFEKIEMSNLMSVGNAPLCIEYSRHKKTLVSADNGSGKSSILLDSLVFVLFGKPYRNITKPQLINSINGKKMLVKIWFSIGADKYNIVRGMKPNIFEIYKNDKLVNEDASGRDYQRHLENNILKMNYRTFTQVVVLSQLDYIPFMKLAAAHRRAFIEDILDIGIFSVMNNLLKDKIKQSEDDERRINADIRTIKEKAKMQVDFIKTLEDDRANRVSEIKTKVAALNTDIDALNIEGETLRVKMSPLEEEMKQLPRVRAKLDEIDNLIKQFEKTRAKHTNDLIFYETMTNCPTCKQNIGEDHKTHILHTVNGKLEQIETAAAQIATKVDTYQEKMIQLLNKQKELTAMMMELGEINTSINVSHELIAKYQREIIDISNQTGNIDDERNKLNDMAKQAVALNNNKKKLLDERMYHDTIHGMLKDSGIKTRIIRQYIPVFNRLIDKYLQEMDLFVNFTLDENFNEVIKSRYRDIFTYGSFSAGEQQRIDLSMLFVFREIARLKNAVSTNLLIMDEVLDSHLEEKGVDSFFSIISKFDNTNIFVISHRENISDRFDSTIRLIKRNNFTNIE